MQGTGAGIRLLRMEVEEVGLPLRALSGKLTLVSLLPCQCGALSHSPCQTRPPLMRTSTGKVEWTGW